MLSNRAMRRKKALGMAGGLEALQNPLPLAGGLVRILGAVIQPFMLSVLDAHQDLPLRCAIAGKFVGDDNPWRTW